MNSDFIVETFESSGGTRNVSYSFDGECHNIRVGFEKEDQEDTWFTLDKENSILTISASTIEHGITNRDANIFVYVNDDKCEYVVKISQTGESACNCETDIDNITIPTINYSGITAENTVIGQWGYKASSTCSEVPTLVVDESYNVEGLRCNENGDIIVNSIPQNPTFKMRNIPFTLRIDDSVCDYSISQDGGLECKCENAKFFIKVFKTTFNFNGTNGSVLIGSGQTSCGSIRLVTDSDMVEGRELEIRTEGLTDGEFEVWGNIKKDENEETRRTGVMATLFDSQGQIIGDGCDIGYGLIQSDTACTCSIRSITPVFPNRYGWEVKIGDEYWFNIDEYDEREAHWSLSYVSNSCIYYKFEYDESIVGAGTSFSTKKHWFRPFDSTNSFRLFFNPDIVIDEPVRTVIKVYQYVDAVVENDELKQGFPCGQCDERKIVLHKNMCNCELECGAVFNDSSAFALAIPGDSGEYSGYTNFYCAREGRSELTFDGGLPDWATIEDFTFIDDQGNGWPAWKLTYEENDSDSDRYLRIYSRPIIDGLECECLKPINYIKQVPNANQCSNCETAMKKMYASSEVYTSPCSGDLGYKRPATYGGDCGSIGYDIVSVTPSSATSMVQYVSSQNALFISKNDSDTDWVIEYRAYIEKNGRPLFSNCYTATKTITVKPCVCSCESRITQFKFTPSTISEEYPNKYPNPIKLGTVGVIDPADTCLEYQAVSTQPEVTVSINSNREVIARIGDIGDNPSMRIDIAVNLRDIVNNFECAHYDKTITFNIVKQ